VVAFLLFLSGCEPVPSTPSAGSPTIYAFSAPGCSGCLSDKTLLLKLERAGYTIRRVNVAIYPGWQRKYRFDAVPFYLVIRRGKVVLRTHDLNLVIRTVWNASSVQSQAAMSQLP
jgi:hypothetical protein